MADDMPLAQARELVAMARQGGTYTNLPAIAYEVKFHGVDPDSDEALTTPCVTVEPVPHPLLEATLALSTATRRGDMSWSVGMGEENGDPTPLNTMLQLVRPGLLVHESEAQTADRPRDMAKWNGHQGRSNLWNNAFGHSIAGWMFTGARNAQHRVAWPTDGDRFGGVMLANSATAWIRFFTNVVELPDYLPEVNLHLRPAGKQAIEPKMILAWEAVAVTDWLSEEGVTVVDADPTGALTRARGRLATSVVAVPAIGSPAKAEVSVGATVRGLLPTLGAPRHEGIASRVEVDAVMLSETLAAAPIVPAVLHPGVKDVVEMVRAKPVDDERLRGYQAEAVGLHLSTDLGYLNACSPGMGKTVMTLVSMRERAMVTPGYRGMVVVEANVRDQWRQETEKWFPEAKVVTITAAKQGPELAVALAEAGDDPVVVIASYAMLRPVAQLLDVDDLTPYLGTPARPKDEVSAADNSTDGTLEDAVDALMEENGQYGLFGLDIFDTAPAENKDETTVQVGQDVTVPVTDPSDDDEPLEGMPADLGAIMLTTWFDDLIADEAEVLRSTGSKQSHALWRLRKSAGVAVALTGTPINKGLDDMGRLVSWVRGDFRMFRGVKLSERFDLSKDTDLAEFAASMGPVVFRRDTSEISDELPTINAVMMNLIPSPAEKALADAAKNELKRVYDELSAAIETAEALDPENPAFALAREELAKARGAWLGGTSLARMAASDPAALLTSDSPAAMLLAGQGLIEAATRVTGTKRSAVVTDVVNRVTNGEAIIVFTEFATVAKGIIEDLDASGVRVGGILGGGGKARDRAVQDFQRGDLDVLVATSAGERGLNLQRATTLYHYDLPWTPKGVIQRTGRARRLKSENQQITVVFPLMADTIEERVAAMVVSRAVEAMRALDTSRGVDASKTEMGLALGGLADSVSDTREGRSHGNMLMEVTRQLVG